MTSTAQAPSSSRENMFDAGQHWRAKLGFVLLAMEQTIEDDLFRLAPDGVGIHVSRAAMSDTVAVDTLHEMRQYIGPAAQLLLPALCLDSVCYGCTSGTIVIGDDEINADLVAATGAKRTSTLAAGVVRALRAVGAQRISVVTAYVAGINALEEEYFTRHGFSVDTLVGLGIELDQDIARVKPSFLADYAASVAHPDSDALFISCGALRTLDIIGELEARTGKPVVTSNQAMMWDCLRGVGIDDKFDNYGRLFREF
jgi:maleate isomerase